MSKKQHQQQCDEAEQQRLYHDSIRSYWTPEKIRNAKVKRFRIPGKKQEHEQANALQVDSTEVPDQLRIELPYKNVGRILFTQGIQDGVGTAYVVKNATMNNIVHIIFTVKMAVSQKI